MTTELVVAAVGIVVIILLALIFSVLNEILSWVKHACAWLKYIGELDEDDDTDPDDGEKVPVDIRRVA